MRATFWLGVFLAAAGPAWASVPQPHAAVAQRDGAAKIAGGVWLPPRPLPGTLPRMPDFTWPVLGPHGGQLAARSSQKAG